MIKMVKDGFPFEHPIMSETGQKNQEVGKKVS